MTTQEKTYVTASELAETLDISMGKTVCCRLWNSVISIRKYMTILMIGF